MWGLDGAPPKPRKQLLKRVLQLRSRFSPALDVLNAVRLGLSLAAALLEDRLSSCEHGIATAAAFSRRSDPQRTAEVRLGPSLAAALPQDPFEHPQESLLKRSSSFVLVSLRDSTYRKGTPRLLALLRPRWEPV